MAVTIAANVINSPLNAVPISFDGLPNTDFKLVFPKLPLTTMFLQTLNVASISVGVAPQETRYVNLQNVGEKLSYQPFSATFLVDKNMLCYNEIYEWMKRMTVSGSSVGETDNPYLMIGSKAMMTFVDAWPMSLDGLNFKANETGTVYLSASVTFNYDYLIFTE